MSRRKTFRVLCLGQWLLIATAELSAPAKERIRLEIEAHYADAVQCHLTNGSTEEAAEAAALAELGDAKVAAKRFRWRHLTEEDATHIEKLLRLARSNFLLPCIYAIAVFLLWFFHESKLYASRRAFLTALILLAVTIQTVNFFVAKGNISKPNLRLFMSLQMLYWLIWLSMMTFSIGLKSSTLPFVFVMPFTFTPYFRIWMKVWKIKDAHQEMPLPRRYTVADLLR